MRQRFITGILIMAGVLGGALSAQTSVPGSGGYSSGEDSGTHPTHKKPIYTPPSLPEYLRKKINLSQPLLITPGGNSADLLKQQQEKSGKNKVKVSRYESRDYTDGANTPADHRRFQRSVLRQFGVNFFVFRGPEKPHTETTLRRTSVVFLLALPITAGFSYGVVMASKGTLGAAAPGLNQGETIGVALGGLILAGAVAYYDYRQMAKLRTGHKHTDSAPVPESQKLRKKKLKKSSSFNRDDAAGRRAELYSRSQRPFHQIRERDQKVLGIQWSLNF